MKITLNTYTNIKMDLDIQKLKSQLETQTELTLNYKLGKIKQGTPLIEFFNNELFLEIHSNKKTFTIEVLEITEKGSGLVSKIFSELEFF